jgi:hypothetical protein
MNLIGKLVYGARITGYARQQLENGSWRVYAVWLRQGESEELVTGKRAINKLLKSVSK